MNISGPAAVAKPEMLFYAPGDLTVTSQMQVDSNSCGDVVEDGAKTAPMDRQVHRGCCYTMILLTLTFS